ncbi:hypothetical protein ACTFIU_004072, partial [Dictyostelium citrinum]
HHISVMEPYRGLQPQDIITLN